MTKFEATVYGISQEQIKQQYMRRTDLLEMTVMGLLSDVQELTAESAVSETVRKQLNIAKFILSEMIDQRMERV